MKLLKQLLIVLLLVSGLTSLYFAIVSANFFSSNKVDTLNIKKIIFAENEWHTFVDKNGNIDNDMFISAFLLKMENQAHIQDIKFIFKDNKVEVNIWNEFKNYKWYYQLEKA
ncbi:hypothetical protein [Mesoplasma coleopterae]|uniref:Uncharacterized protein n=1 Tax=Mesoplasma coleopterae TaxID=324078 RepID=A0A2K8P2Z6_9MOLU|nr:hypothetical protein [Mesoplasma coleopterae]ATZ21131.1 hypothetical protein MCOLE_v1c06200 [Mesoplasma coleopterae]AVN62609.1 hypothetical protein CG001_03140 [Mesoplasma coleopterae]AVN63291.1 hypothetical protein CG000_03270 [Mesoplasma coleopterae]